MRKLSDKQWSIIEPLLPKQDFSHGGRPRVDNRRIFEAIRWVLTTGAQWNEVPTKYGSGKTAWKRFTAWKRQGVWKRIWQQLLVMLDKQDKITWDIAYLDGTFASAKKGDLKMARRNGGKGQK